MTGVQTCALPILPFISLFQTVVLNVMIVKNKVFYVQLLDMYNVVQKFGDDFDYAKEFEKTVVLMTALRG